QRLFYPVLEGIAGGGCRRKCGCDGPTRSKRRRPSLRPIGRQAIIDCFFAIWKLPAAWVSGHFLGGPVVGANQRRGAFYPAFHHLIGVCPRAAETDGTNKSNGDQFLPAPSRRPGMAVVIEFVFIGKEILVEFVAMRNALRQPASYIVAMKGVFVRTPSFLRGVARVVIVVAIGLGILVK